MICLDCSTQTRDTPAVGTCTNCGAGVCRDHLELDTHVVGHYAGVGTAHEYPTRAVTCSACAPALKALHPHGFAATVNRSQRVSS